MTTIDTDTAVAVLTTALDMCGAIRRDFGWARSADSTTRHAAILRDMIANIIPRCDSRTALMLTGAINGERAAFAARHR